MKIKLLIPFLFLTLLLSACGHENSTSTAAPFTNATWKSQLDQICESEGTEYEKSLSMSGGYNYIFPKQYLGYDGFVQYNIDDSENLVSVSWYYIGDNSDIAKEIYKAVQAQATTDLGQANLLNTSNIHSGSQWETDDQKVILISLAQEGEFAVQITYLPKDK